MHKIYIDTCELENTINNKEELNSDLKKLDAATIWEQMEYWKIIEECEYNQTSKKPTKNKKWKNDKKSIRKKTVEELRLLEYFLLKDPEWSRSTIVKAARVLGMTCYQIYKWGYDRKNRQETFYDSNLIEEYRDNKEIMQKIEEFNREITYTKDTDFNKQVDDLLFGGAKYINFDKNWTEFLISELNMINNQCKSTSSNNENTPKPSKIYRKRYSKIFRIEKSKRFKKNDHLEEDIGSKNLSSLFCKDSNLFNFNSEKNLKSSYEEKAEDTDIVDLNSDITNDRSSTSAIVKDNSGERLSQCDISQHADIDDLLNNVVVDKDYFNCSKALSKVSLPGISNENSEQSSPASVSDHSSSYYHQEDEEYFNNSLSRKDNALPFMF